MSLLHAHGLPDLNLRVSFRHDRGNEPPILQIQSIQLRTDLQCLMPGRRGGHVCFRWQTLMIKPTHKYTSQNNMPAPKDRRQVARMDSASSLAMKHANSCGTRSRRHAAEQRKLPLHLVLSDRMERSRTCDNCGDAGHFARACPHPPKCFLCRGAHKKQDCPRLQQQQQQPQLPAQQQPSASEDKDAPRNVSCFHCRGPHLKRDCPLLPPSREEKCLYCGGPHARPQCRRLYPAQAQSDPCPFWNRPGGCRQGAACRWVHGGDGGASSHRTVSAPAAVASGTRLGGNGAGGGVSAGDDGKHSAPAASVVGPLSARSKCFLCDSTSHFVRDCPKLHEAKMPKAAVADEDKSRGAYVCFWILCVTPCCLLFDTRRQGQALVDARVSRVF